jgi:hypothetical protein
MSLELSPQLQMAAMQKYFPFHLIPDCPQQVHIGKRYKYRSPFRHDSTPGCWFDWDKSGRLTFFDYAADKFVGGDCISTVMKRFSLLFLDALKLIKNDASLQVMSNTISAEIMQPDANMCVIGASPTSTTSNNGEQEIKWRIITRKWNDEDDKFWLHRYGINADLRDKYNIKAVSRAYKTLFLGCENQFYQYAPGTNDPCYCYSIDDRVKFYRPYNTKFKWVGNVKKENVQGYAQLPESGDVLVIAASLKDALCLIAIGIPAIAPQSETTFLPLDVINNIKERFTNVYVLFDLDSTGTHYSCKYAEQHGLHTISLPSHIDAGKDIADFRENLGEDEFRRGMYSLIYQDDVI